MLWLLASAVFTPQSGHANAPALVTVRIVAKAQGTRQDWERASVSERRERIVKDAGGKLTLVRTIEFQ